MDTTQNPETPVVNTDEAKSRVRNFLDRHQRPVRIATTVTGLAAAFAVGRKSKDLVSDVDLVIETPQSGSESS